MTERDGAVRWLGLALLFSLGINLLLGGFVIGREYLSLHDRPAPPPAPLPAPGPTPGPGPAPVAPQPAGGLLQRVQALPPAERQRFRQVVRPYQPEIAAARAAFRAAQADLSQAVRKEPYDKEAVRAAFARMRETGARAQELAQQAAVEGLAALSPSSREAISAPPAR